jgi:hypothetical protein
MKHALMTLSVFLLGFQTFAVIGHSVATFHRYSAGNPPIHL